jgi:HlyD family secretion protein
MKKISIISLISIFVLAACASTPTPAPASHTVASPTPERGFVPTGGVIASAKVIPVYDAYMSFPLSAPVDDVLVQEGDVVKAGQKLVALYAPELELAVTAAEADVKAKEAEYILWIPRLDRPPERREQARAEMEQAKAKLETARAMLAQATLAAPFDAVVVEINVQPGELAQAGQVVITLGDIAHMQVQTTDLSERDVPEVQVGQVVNVFVEALNATLSGKVARISPMPDTVGGDVVYPVTIELDQQIDGLFWGMSAEVEIQTTP